MTTPAPRGPRAVLLIAAAATTAASLTACSVSDPSDHALHTFERRSVVAKLEKIQAGDIKRADEPDAALEYFMNQRLGDRFEVYPVERYVVARERVEQIERDRRADADLGIMRRAVGGIQGWSELGPGNIGGRTRSILISPVDPSIMYAAGVGGGVFKSTDAGASWSAQLDFAPNIAVNSMAMDPQNPDVIYAGTGEGFFNGDAIRGLGIFKTTDGGANWTQLPGTLDGVVETGAFYRCNKLQTSPNQPDTVYAATRFGVWRSTDAGANWELVLENNNFSTTPVQDAGGTFAGALDLQVRPGSIGSGEDDSLYATFGSFSKGALFRSTDGGDTWTNISVGTPLDVPNQGRMTVAIAPSNPDFVYVCMADNGTLSGSSGGGTGQIVDVFLSTDAGDTWTARLNPASDANSVLLSNPIASVPCGGSSFLNQGWYDNIIAVDPANESIVYVGGVDLFRSDDGAANFRPMGYWFLDGDEPQGLHADMHEIVFHPGYNGTTNQTMFAGNDGGVYRTDNARADLSDILCPDFVSDLSDVVWTDLNNGYGVTQFYHGDASANSDLFIGGAQDNGTSGIDSVGAPNSWTDLFGGDGGYVAISSTNPDTLFLETQRFANIRGTTNGGASYFNASVGLFDSNTGEPLDSGLFITPFEMDPSDDTILWTGGGDIWRTTTSGVGWANVSNFAGSQGTVSAIAIDRTQSNNVIVGFSSGLVATTNNALAPNPSWTVRDEINGLNTGFISSVAIDPNNPNTIYATSSSFGTLQVWKSENFGNFWTSIDGIGLAGIPDIPVHWIEVRPGASDQLFVGAEVGVFASDDGGVTWSIESTGLPNTVVETLEFQNPDTLVAFTHGRGAFITALDPIGPQPNGCPADVTATGTTLPGQPGFGVPDGNIDADDLGYFLSFFLAADPVTDVTTTGATLPGQPGFGEPDGVVDPDDLGYFLGFWLSGCP